MRHKMKRIQSKLHRIGTYDVCKIYFSCFDDKRYILSDGINSLTYFHKDVESQQNWVKSIKSIKSLKLIKSSQINKKVVSMEQIFWALFLSSSIYIKGKRTIFFNCVLEKQKEEKEKNRACFLTPY